jgi:hypothetical protein
MLFAGMDPWARDYCDCELSSSCAMMGGIQCSICIRRHDHSTSDVSFLTDLFRNLLDFSFMHTSEAWTHKDTKALINTPTLWACKHQSRRVLDWKLRDTQLTCSMVLIRSIGTVSPCVTMAQRPPAKNKGGYFEASTRFLAFL